MNKLYYMQKDAKVVFLNKKAMKSFIKMTQKKKQMTFVTGSILSLIAVLAIVNDKIVFENNRLVAMNEAASMQGQGRGLASVPGIASQSFQNAFQEKMANELKKSMQQEQAILAKAPSREDSFLKGYLSGNYKLNKDSQNHLSLTHMGGEKTQVGNMNSLLLELIETFYEGEFSEISRISQAATKTEFEIKSNDGTTASVLIMHDKDKRLQSIEMK